MRFKHTRRTKHARRRRQQSWSDKLAKSMGLDVSANEAMLATVMTADGPICRNCRHLVPNPIGEPCECRKAPAFNTPRLSITPELLASVVRSSERRGRRR